MNRPEAAARREIAAGKARSFRSIADLATWLDGDGWPARFRLFLPIRKASR